MTSIDSASRAQPSRPSSPNHEARADPNDARAMRDAIDAARTKLDKFAGQTGKRSATGLTAGAKGHEGAATAGAERLGADAGQVRAQNYQQRDGTEAMTGWAGQGGIMAGAPVQLNPPPAHVDPGAFAQLLADLWTRENGRGSKEVRVQFGDRTWPATGARLVRNAAGSLDVQLYVADGGRAYGDRLAGLEDALSQAGVDLGSLEIEQGG